MLAKLREVPGGRRIVIFSLTVGIAMFVFELTNGHGLDRSLGTGGGLAFLLMVLLSFAKGLWQGREVDEAGVGGASAKFAPLARVTLRPIRALEQRVFVALEEINARIRDLDERVVAV